MVLRDDDVMWEIEDGESQVKIKVVKIVEE